MTQRRLTKVLQENLPPDLRDVKDWAKETGLVYKVKCKRRSSPGFLHVEVRAASPEAAMQRVREGKAEAIGLGWLPVSAVVVS